MLKNYITYKKFKALPKAQDNPPLTRDRKIESSAILTPDIDFASPVYIKARKSKKKKLTLFYSLLCLYHHLSQGSH